MLHYAVRKGNDEGVERLLAFEVRNDILSGDVRGKVSPLQLAEESGKQGKCVQTVPINLGLRGVTHRRLRLLWPEGKGL